MRVIFLEKNNISVKNVDVLEQYLTGGTLSVVLIMIGFSVVKFFALIFPPAKQYLINFNPHPCRNDTDEGHLLFILKCTACP